MKSLSTFAFAALGLLASAMTAQAGDDLNQQNHNHNNHNHHDSSHSKSSGGHGQGSRTYTFSDMVRSFKKVYHHHPSNNQGQSPVVPFPPIVSDPIPTPKPVVRDHRTPTGPWGLPGGQVDAGNSSGGVIVTTTPPKGTGPVIRDHRTGTGPVVRDHRTQTGPIIRDHRNN